MISFTPEGTFSIAMEVDEQKGPKSRDIGNCTCLLIFRRPVIVCWKRLTCIVNTAGGQKTSSCLDALLYTISFFSPAMLEFLEWFSLFSVDASLAYSFLSTLFVESCRARLSSFFSFVHLPHAHLLLPVNNSGAVNCVRQEYTEHSPGFVLYLGAIEVKERVTHSFWSCIWSNSCSRVLSSENNYIILKK